MLPEEFNGLILLNKEVGMTSFSAIAQLRRMTGIKKIGHTGTLDPFAEGLLPILFGRYTRLARYIENTDKVYEVEFVIGKATDTLDITGHVITEDDAVMLRQRVQSGELEQTLQSLIKSDFSGEIEQIPPMYSAVKVKGKPLYKYAREGVELQRKKRKVTIFDAKLSGIYQEQGDLLAKAIIHCSKGTYIRTWVDDLLKKADSCGCAKKLKRISSGSLSLGEKSVSLQTLLDQFAELQTQEKMRDLIKDKYFSPIESALLDLLTYPLSDQEYQKVVYGQPIKIHASKMIDQPYPELQPEQTFRRKNEVLSELKTEWSTQLSSTETLLLKLKYAGQIIAIAQFNPAESDYAKYQCVLADSHSLH